MDAEDAFSETSLTEKLTKLNSSQQSIESLSHWCISHREKAKQIVETWQALFNTVPKERRVSFLYLANDILQNSRRKGSEFVSEFWKVLPKVLRGVCDGREENCKKVASRLVDIWTERKVFGSRGEKLKNEFLSKKSSPSRKPSSGKNLSHINVEKSSNPIKVLKRDANSLRIRLAVGGLPEKILSAFRLVHDETVNEEDALKDCQDAVLYLRDIENEVIASRPGDPVGPDTVSDIQKQETMLRHGISCLEKIEANRLVLISQLQEALQSHESKLQLIRNELLTAHGLIEHAGNMKRRLSENMKKESPVEPTNHHLITPGPRTQPVGSLTKPTVSHEESNRAAAAAVAAKLAASTSSAQMLSSVLSSLMAEELMNGSPKRLKLEKPEDPKRASPAHFQGVTALAPPLQSFLPPPPLPPPLVPPPGFPAVQLAQPSMAAGLSYGPSVSPFPIPGLPQPLPPGSNGGYYGSVSVGFDREGHQRGALPPPPVNPPQ